MASLCSLVNLRLSGFDKLLVLDSWKNGGVYPKGRNQLLYDTPLYCTIQLLYLVAPLDIKRIVFIFTEPSTSLWDEPVTHLLHVIYDYHYK